MSKSNRENQLNRLFHHYLLELQNAHQKMMEYCLNNSEVTPQFLQILHQHTEEIISSANQIAASGKLEEPIHETSPHYSQESRDNVVALIKSFIDDGTLTINQIGCILGISRPRASMMIYTGICPDDKTISRAETMLQHFSLDELRLLLPLLSLMRSH